MPWVSLSYSVLMPFPILGSSSNREEENKHVKGDLQSFRAFLLQWMSLCGVSAWLCDMGRVEARSDMLLPRTQAPQHGNRLQCLLHASAPSSLPSLCAQMP